MRRRSRPIRIVLTLVSLLLAGGICVASLALASGAGVPSPSHRPSIDAWLGRTSLDAGWLAPGGSTTTPMSIANLGDVSWGSLELDVTTSDTSPLIRHRIDGLQLRVDACSLDWRPSTSGAMSCPGRLLSVVASRPVLGRGVELSGLRAATPGGHDVLRVMITLPRSAGNDMQGQSAMLDVAVRAGQFG